MKQSAEATPATCATVSIEKGKSRRHAFSWRAFWNRKRQCPTCSVGGPSHQNLRAGAGVRPRGCVFVWNTSEIGLAPPIASVGQRTHLTAEAWVRSRGCADGIYSNLKAARSVAFDQRRCRQPIASGGQSGFTQTKGGKIQGVDPKLGVTRPCKTPHL